MKTKRPTIAACIKFVRLCLAAAFARRATHQVVGVLAIGVFFWSTRPVSAEISSVAYFSQHLEDIVSMNPPVIEPRFGSRADQRSEAGRAATYGTVGSPYQTHEFEVSVTAEKNVAPNVPVKMSSSQVHRFNMLGLEETFWWKSEATMNNSSIYSDSLSFVTRNPTLPPLITAEYYFRLTAWDNQIIDIRPDEEPFYRIEDRIRFNANATGSGSSSIAFDKTIYDIHATTPVSTEYSVLEGDVNFSNRPLIPEEEQYHTLTVEYERVLEFGNIVAYLASVDVSLYVDSTHKFFNDGPGLNRFLRGDTYLNVSNSLDIVGILIRDETGAIRTDVDVTSAEGVNFPLLSAPITIPQRPISNVILSPVAATESALGTFSGDVVLENMIDQSGLAKSFVNGETSFDQYVFEGNTPAADDDYNGYWQSFITDADEYPGVLDFDLGDEYLVDRIALWNGTADDVEAFVALSPTGPWESVGTFALENQNPLLYPLVEPQILDLAGEHLAQYLRLQVNSAHTFYSFAGYDFKYAIIREIAVSASSTSDSSGLPGDINLDGIVDGRDAAEFARYYGMPSGGTWTTGDFDFDGAITSADLAILQAHLGQSIAVSQSAAAVPEPSSFSLFALGLLAATVTSFRRRRRFTDEAAGNGLRV